MLILILTDVQYLQSVFLALKKGITKIICETQPESMACTDVKVHFLAVNWKNLIQLLTHFKPMFPFLTFSGGTEREHWPEMG